MEFVVTAAIMDTVYRYCAVTLLSVMSERHVSLLYPC